MKIGMGVMVTSAAQGGRLLNKKVKSLCFEEGTGVPRLWLKLFIFVFLEDTGALRLWFRLFILIFLAWIAYLIYHCLPHEFSIPGFFRKESSDLSLSKDTREIYRTFPHLLTIRATLSSLPIILWLWVLRTDDKLLEFRGRQKQLGRDQINKAVDLLASEELASRGLGASRLTDLYRREIIDRDEYRGYMGICKSWKSEKNKSVNSDGTSGEGTIWATGAYLVGAYLEGANWRGASLGKANLGRADLRGANLERANLEGANLEGANLEGTTLREPT